MQGRTQFLGRSYYFRLSVTLPRRQTDENYRYVLPTIDVGTRAELIEQWLFRHPAPTILSRVSHLLTIPPFSLIPHTLPYLSKFGAYPSEQLAVIKSLVTSPHVVYSAMTMAHDEMNTIGSLGSVPSTVQATCERERERIYACFAAEDGWVGDEVLRVRRMLEDSQVVVRTDDVPHAFCIGKYVMSK